MSISQAQTPLAADKAQFSTTDVSRFSGASIRQLDYWCRIGALVPTIDARGSGTQRRYTAHEARMAWAIYVTHKATSATNSPGGGMSQRVGDALRQLDGAWTGQLVVGAGGLLVVEHALALLDALTELGPAVVVVDLDACPDPLGSETEP